MIVQRLMAAALVALTSLAATQGVAADIDNTLDKVIRAYTLRPLPTKPFEATKKFVLGQALFFDPILSGNRDVSCATCHLLRRGTSDALPVSIGINGSGLGENRRLTSGHLEHPRNSLDLWNRDNDSVTALFWDGRVEVLQGRPFETPLGDKLPGGLENALAAQALFPLAREDEMLGRNGERSNDRLPAGHANLLNELASETAELAGAERSLAVYELILERLIGNDPDKLLGWQKQYRRLFRAAFPEKEFRELSITDAANAIAHFEEIAFATRETPWDRYLAGQQDAISESAKRGALIFYGRGRCAVCHSGPLFSDFGFHSLMVRGAKPGIDGTGEDLGRFIVTGNPADRYKFRTPPLRNVTLTAPYFHNGTAKTLREAIAHHLNPLAQADQYLETGAFAYSLEQIDSLAPVLVPGTPLEPDEIDQLVDFLTALEDSQRARAHRIIPRTIPSGLPVSAIAGN